jgi:hypothetical protein
MPQVQPPMIYVYERQEWEYQVVIRDAAEKEPLSERELNELGTIGWEIVGVVTLSRKVQCYFKRVRR